MTKRSFQVDTTSISTVRPVLDNGFYAGEITDPTIIKKDGTSFFKIVEHRVYNKKDKQWEDTGKYTISGMLMYSATLTSKKAMKAVAHDSPRVFGSPIFLRYSPDTLALEATPAIGQLLAIAAIEGDLGEQLDWEFDENVEIPEELANVDNAVNLLNALEYTKAFFSLLCQLLQDIPVKVNVVKRPNQDNNSILENRINITNDFCGFLPYEEGCEEDLDEE